jgi:hypothetical protein
MPGWLGEPLDVDYAIDVLHPRAAQVVVDSFDSLASEMV